MDLFGEDKIIIQRRYYPYTLWEDFKSGMYNPLLKGLDDEEHIRLSASLLSDSKELRIVMELAINKWPFAADHNLSNLSCNRRAWLGQSACFLKYKIPSYLTGRAWFTLSNEVQRVANSCADEVIKIYENEYIERNAKKILR